MLKNVDGCFLASCLPIRVSGFVYKFELANQLFEILFASIIGMWTNEASYELVHGT